MYQCPKCQTVFEKITLSGEYPGGKEREDIDCPNCGETVGTVVTSAVISTREVIGDRKAAFLAGKTRIIQPQHFVTGSGESVLTDDGQQGMRGAHGIGSTTERRQGQVAAAIFANCAHLDNQQLDEIIEWVRLYKK